MTFPDESTVKTITLTSSAAAAVRDVMAKKNLEGYALRVFVSGGGCSGLQYSLALDSNIRAEDVVTETDGIKLLIDEVSIKYMQGATIDYVDDLTSAGFKINNPTSYSTCNCGQSFNSGDKDEGGSASDCPDCG